MKNFSALLLLLVTQTAGAIIYDATSQFDSDKNPSGVWSYGWMPNDFSLFNVYPDSRIEPKLGKSTVWYQKSVGTEPNVWRNDSKETWYKIPPGQLGLHPGSNGQPSVLRFTAPSDGIADIKWEFYAGDNGAMKLGVRNANDFLWNELDSGLSGLADYDFLKSDILDFMVYGGYSYGNTGLAVKIDFTESEKKVPEPTPLALLMLGLIGLHFSRKAKKT